MPIHIFINRTNFIPYRALYAVEFYINFGRNFHCYFILSGFVFDFISIFQLYFDFLLNFNIIFDFKFDF